MKNNLVKILATLGLIVAIALILKGVFGVGKIVVKKIVAKSSSTKSLPMLKCEINDTDGSKKTQFYDLDKIKNNDPTENMSTEQFKKWRSKKNLEATTFGDNKSMNNYIILYINHENGISKGWSAQITKDTGEIEISFPKNTPVDASLQDVMTSYEEATVFKGVCVKVKRKNL